MDNKTVSSGGMGMGVMPFNRFIVNIVTDGKFSPEELKEVHKSHEPLLKSTWNNIFDDMISSVHTEFCNKFDNIPEVTTFKDESLRSNGIDGKEIIIKYLGNNDDYKGCIITFKIPGYPISDDERIRFDIICVYDKNDILTENKFIIDETE